MVKMNEKGVGNRRALLINPRAPDNCGYSYYIPTGLLHLASVCETNMYLPTLLDLNTLKPHLYPDPNGICIEYIASELRDVKPDVVLLGCLFSGQFPQSLLFAKLVKSIYPEVPILIGGIHATTYPIDIIENCPEIDFVVVSEGELALDKYLKKLSIKDSSYEDIGGFCYRNSNRGVVLNPVEDVIQDIDNIKLPAYHLIDIGQYKINTESWHNPKDKHIHASIPIITSRGCPLKCNFCSLPSVMGSGHRQRSVENVLSEIMYFYYDLNQNYFSFMDDNFTLKKKFVIDLCNRISASGMDIQFDLPNGIMVNGIDDEIVDAMVSAGLVRVALAIESGSHYIRQSVIGKLIHEKKIYDVIRSFRRHSHVKIRAFFIIGFPEDTHETLSETYSMIEDLDIDVPEFSALIPFEGTSVFAQAIKDNLFISTIDPKNLWRTPISPTGTNMNGRFFIKPYNLELSELESWWLKINDLVNKKVAQSPLVTHVTY